MLFVLVAPTRVMVSTQARTQETWKSVAERERAFPENHTKPENHKSQAWDPRLHQQG